LKVGNLLQQTPQIRADTLLVDFVFSGNRFDNLRFGYAQAERIPHFSPNSVEAKDSIAPNVQ
jgi:hypothetical protein